MNGAPLLRLRLALVACSPVAAGALVLGLAAVGALAWLAQARAGLERQQAETLRRAPAPAPAAADANLALFHGALGERRYAEQQVKTLFALAARSGLVLRQGEYKAGYDRDARIHTYQVSLPVKGSYRAVWQFAMLALRAIPFASLDEISFRRDAIGQADVEARLRLTLYLSGAAPEGAS